MKAFYQTAIFISRGETKKQQELREVRKTCCLGFF